MKSKSISCVGLILIFFVQINTLFCQNTFELPTVTSAEKSTVTLDQFHVNVSVVGSFAITTYDMTFKNSSSRVLEGQLNLPMQEGESVIGYQLEVNGKMRKGVVVDKEEARQIFEEIVNRQVDPGIIEKTQGNNYRTRLYPIPANGFKRVIITTQQNMVKDGTKYNYLLPFASNQVLSKFSLVLELFQNNKPQLSPNYIGDLNFESVENIYRMSLKKENFILKEPLQFAIPDQEQPYTPLYEKNEKEQFFYQKFNYAYDELNQNTPPKLDPTSITLLWDISFSGITRNKEKEIEMMQAIFQAFPDKNITLVAFNDKIVFQQNYKSNQTADVIAKINSFNFDGTTDLTFIENLKLKSKGLVLLFSDGINGLGQVTQPNTSNPNLFSIVTSTSNDFDALQNVSKSNVLNLNRISVASAVNKIQFPPITLLAVEVVSGNVTDLYPKVGSSVYTNLEVCGKFIGNEATINLVYGYAGTTLFTHTVRVKYDKNNDLAYKSDYVNTLISRFWAQNEIQHLQKLLPKSKNKIKFIAKKYGIVTNFTSLIVLETLADYMRYNVQPPAELKEEYDKYMERTGKSNVAEKKVVTADEIVDRDEQIYYKPLLDWWNSSIKTINPIKNTSNTIQTSSNNFENFISDTLRYNSPEATIIGTGILKGKITDSLNIGIPNMMLLLVTGDSLHPIVIDTDTDENGDYSFMNIPNSIYKLIVGGFEYCQNIDEYPNIVMDGSIVFMENISFYCKIFEEMNDTLSVEFNISYNSNNVSYEDVPPPPRHSTESVTSYSVDYSVSNFGGVENLFDSEVVGNFNFTPNNGSTIVPQKTISVKPYNPNEPYMEVYHDSIPNKEIYQVYLNARVNYTTSPSYFVDVADLFFQRGLKDTAKMILANILEITNENFQMVQIYGKKLTEYGFYKEAVPAFKYITELREEFPQSFRDYALTCQYAGQYQEAYDVFAYILTTRWNRFDDLKPIVFTDFNGLLNLYGKKIDQKNLNPKLRANFPVGMRVVISWDTDNCDIDLHVKEPDGTICFYNHNLTKNGGKMSQDFTVGFGPEQYMMKTNMEGIYEILANYYGSQSQSELMPVTVYADVFTDYGTQKQEHKRISLRLKNKKDIYSLGEIDVKTD